MYVLQIKRTLIPPSNWNEEYNLTRHKTLQDIFNEREDLSGDLSLEMEELYLKDVRNGFFIEAGAGEGVIPIHHMEPNHSSL